MSVSRDESRKPLANGLLSIFSLVICGAAGEGQRLLRGASTLQTHTRYSHIHRPTVSSQVSLTDKPLQQRSGTHKCDARLLEGLKLALAD